MKIYTKPSVNVIELAIEENIAAIVPKTIYKKNKTGTGADYLFDKVDSTYDPGISIPTGFNA